MMTGHPLDHYDGTIVQSWKSLHHDQSVLRHRIFEPSMIALVAVVLVVLSGVVDALMVGDREGVVKIDGCL